MTGWEHKYPYTNMLSILHVGLKLTMTSSDTIKIFANGWQPSTASSTCPSLSSHYFSPDQPDIPDASQAHYPNVRFWNKSNWLKYSAQQKTSPMYPTMEGVDIDGTASFIKDSNGQPVTSSTLKAIQQTAWHLSSIMEQRLPKNY